MDIDQKLEGLYRQHSVRAIFSSGEGLVIQGPPFKREADYKIDYYVLLGKVPVHTIYKYLTKIKIGGILIAEVDYKEFSEVNEVVEFLNRVAQQHAYTYLVDGIKYIFVSRLES